jgi:hypothetical protein
MTDAEEIALKAACVQAAATLRGAANPPSSIAAFAQRRVPFRQPRARRRPSGRCQSLVRWSLRASPLCRFWKADAPSRHLINVFVPIAQKPEAN